MENPIITGEGRLPEEIPSFPPAQWVAKTVGQVMTEYCEDTRRVYGRAPAKAGAEPLPGHEDDVLYEQPNYYKMSEKKFAQLPLNRADYRQRIRPRLPRAVRLATRTNKRLRGL